MDKIKKSVGTPETEGEQQSPEGIGIYLLKYLFEPTKKQLMGLTDIPLAQVNNLAWMAVFDVATEQMCEYMTYKEKCKREGEGFDGAPPEIFSLSAVWSEIYSWLRRSINGAGVMTASTLAMKQLEMQEMGADQEEPLKW